MLFQQKCVAALTLAAFSLSLTLPVLATDDRLTEPVTLEIAHHGGEGLGSAAGVLATTGSTGALQGGVVLRYVNNSIFATSLLSMAYQRDAELQKYAKRLGFANTLTLLAIAGVTGLGLGSSIYTYNSLHEETAAVEDGHVHLHAESRAPAMMGIIGSGATLAALGTQAVVSAHYRRKIQARQIAISTEVDDLIGHLDDGSLAPEAVRTELAKLVGDFASGEFVAFWRLVHPVSVSGKTLPETAK